MQLTFDAINIIGACFSDAIDTVAGFSIFIVIQRSVFPRPALSKVLNSKHGRVSVLKSTFGTKLYDFTHIFPKVPDIFAVWQISFFSEVFNQLI